MDVPEVLEGVAKHNKRVLMATYEQISTKSGRPSLQNIQGIFQANEGN